MAELLARQQSERKSERKAERNSYLNSQGDSGRTPTRSHSVVEPTRTPEPPRTPERTTSDSPTVVPSPVHLPGPTDLPSPSVDYPHAFGSPSVATDVGALVEDGGAMAAYQHKSLSDREAVLKRASEFVHESK